MLARVAQRSSSSVVCSLRSTTALPLVWCHRRYKSTAAHARAQGQGQQQQAQVESLLSDSFKRYNLSPSSSNLDVLKAYDMVREAETLLTHQEDFERAEALLVGTLDYIQRNNIQDQWIIGSANANLGYALQQSFKYDEAINNYTIGIKALSAGTVKDSRFLGLRQLTFAELLSLKGNHQAASNIAQSAVASLKQSEGEESELVGLALSNLASYKMLEGQPKTAVVHAERALQVLELVLGKHNDTTRNCAVNLVNIYKALKRTEDIEELDERFQTEDTPILKPVVGDYSREYLDGLRQKWRAQGPRKIFDPPGLHRSAALSAKSYQAFLSSWKSRRPLTNSEASVIGAELKSLGYSFDKLPTFKARGEDLSDRVGVYQTGFEHLKLKGITKLAAAMDQNAAIPRSTPEERTITPEEWKAAAARQREYRMKHGDPQREAMQDEFEKSESDFSEVDTSEDGGSGEVGMFDFLQEDDQAQDFDNDTYNLRMALFGDKKEQAYERSKSQQNKFGLKPVDEEADLDRIAQEREESERGEGKAQEHEENDEYDENDPDEDSLEVKDPYSPEYFKKLAKEEGRTWADHNKEQNAPENFGTGPSGPTPRRVPNSSSGPYGYNAEEDDVFPNNKTDRSQDRNAEELADDIRRQNARNLEKKQPQYKYGRLHEKPWHDDNN